MLFSWLIYAGYVMRVFCGLCVCGGWFACVSLLFVMVLFDWLVVVPVLILFLEWLVAVASDYVVLAV